MMRTSLTALLVLSALAFSCHAPTAHPDAHSAESQEVCVGLASISDFAADSASHGSLLELPRFELTPAEVKATADRVLADAEVALDGIANQSLKHVTFASGIAAMDHALYPLSSLLNRLWLMKETQQDASMRKACTEQVTRIEAWFVEVTIREDLFKVASTFQERLEAGDVPPLAPEDAKYFSDMMLEYTRAGFALDQETRKHVANLKKQLNSLATSFDTNVTNASVELFFNDEQLKGVPQSFLSSALQEDGMYRVRATVTPDYMSVMQNCSVAETRKKLNSARYSVVMKENGPILNRMVSVRHEIAQALGYATWADYKTETKMAGTGKAAIDFIESLRDRLDPKFASEVDALTQLKNKELGTSDNVIHWWDFRYYQNMLMRENYGVDTSELRHYFPLQKVMDGMFDVYEHIFGLSFIEVDPGYRWVEDLQLYVVQDAQTDEPLGAFYLDLFPREGKYNHFAQFDITGGKRYANGVYQRPVVSLVCNFTPGFKGEPALMNHSEVETIFHEFGHAMHSILTRANYSSMSGANVARDFVEAPSQMFEAWAWDPTILQQFAKDWRDPSKTIPLETLEAMKEADLATKGIHYRRQVGLALADLQMHNGPVQDAGAVCNEANSKALFPVPDGTNFAAYWGHLTGYDAGYYGYAWADAIAADMGTVFENAPNRFLDQDAGRRLRDEIYAVGSSRTAAESVRAFLGRERSLDAFLRAVGISAE